MDTIIILTLLLLMAVGGWIGSWFKYQQVIVYLAMKQVESPTEEEWEKCARTVWLSLWRKERRK